MLWNDWFFNIGASVAKKSKDPSRQVGCVIADDNHNILSVGFNGFARGVWDTEERLTNRDLKYPLTVHAELNAILAAAMNGVSLNGSSIYVSWFPCVGCANAIIQAGIKKVFVDEYSEEDFNKFPIWHFDLAKQVLAEAGIPVITMNQK